MLIAKTENRNDHVYPYTRFKCPSCGVDDMFLSISPEKCRGCGKTIPDIRQLAVDPRYRLDYYKGTWK
jgi:predicted RNA-binding Zn-ribbon protein involved in translation (DUF1610 family)